METIRKNIEKNKSVVVATLLFLIILFGAIMRLWQLGYASYWLDEGFTLIQARGIAIHGYPLLDSGYAEWKDLLIPYTVAPFVKIFGFQHAWALRLIPAVFGILTIFIGYRLAMNIFSWRVGLIFSFFIASCHWYIAWSQQVRGYSAVIFFVLLMFYFLSKFEHKMEAKYIQYAFLSILLAVLAKKFAIILFVPFLVYLLGKKFYRAVFMLGGISGLVAIFFVSKAWQAITINPIGYFAFYVNNYLLEYFGIFIVLAVIGGLVVFWSDSKYKVLNSSILAFVVSTIIVFSAFVFVSERRYLLMITPFIFLYAAYLIEFIAKKFRYHNVVGLVLFIVVIIVSGIYNYSTILIPQKQYNLEYYTPQPNYNKAYNKILEKGFTEDDTIISTIPLLDIIYLGRADYAIPWSLTGREGDTTFRGRQEMYSGAKTLKDKTGNSTIVKIEKLQKKGNVYVVMDSLASRRMEFDLWDDITDLGEEIIKDGSESRVVVYLFPELVNE